MKKSSGEGKAPLTLNKAVVYLLDDQYEFWFYPVKDIPETSYVLRIYQISPQVKELIGKDEVSSSHRLSERVVTFFYKKHVEGVLAW